MAPRVGAKSNQQAAPAPAPTTRTTPTPAAEPSPEQVRRLLADIAGKQAEMLPQSRWVGRDFADAARAMQEGRTAEDKLHGQASPRAAEASNTAGHSLIRLPIRTHRALTGKRRRQQ